jgi:hypothetical protein
MQQLSFPETIKDPTVLGATGESLAVGATDTVNAPAAVDASERGSKESKHDFAKMNGVLTTTENSNTPSQSEPTEEIPEPEEVVTVKQVWQKPWPKASIVGGGMLVLLGTLGSMVHGAMDAINTPAPKTIENAVTTPTPTSEKEDSPGSLKTKNALTSQEYELKTLNQQQMKRHQPTTTPRPRPVALQVPPRISVVERTASSTTAPTTITPRMAAPDPVSLTVQSTKPIAKPQPITPIKANPAPVIDPMQQWEMAANAGSYSSNGSDNAVGQNNSAHPMSSTAHAMNQQSIADQALSLNAPLPENTNPPNVLVGTRVAGKLETPVAWEGVSTTPTQNFLIKLSEPIKGIDKSIVVPQGAYIVATVSKVSSAGLVEMRATKILVNSFEQLLPPESILILAHNGNLLKAQLKNGTRVGSALRTALLNGVATATSLVNEPSSQTTFGSLNSFSSTVRNRTNILAGLAQGTTAQMVQQAGARRERSLSAAGALKVFELPGGTSVQLFFNQSVFLAPGVEPTESSRQKK